eukprot:584016_1
MQGHKATLVSGCFIGAFIVVKYLNSYTEKIEVKAIEECKQFIPQTVELLEAGTFRYLENNDVAVQWGCGRPNGTGTNAKKHLIATIIGTCPKTFICKYPSLGLKSDDVFSRYIKCQRVIADKRARENVGQRQNDSVWNRWG